MGRLFISEGFEAKVGFRRKENMPVACFNRRGFSAEKQIPPSAPLKISPLSTMIKVRFLNEVDHAG